LIASRPYCSRKPGTRNQGEFAFPRYGLESLLPCSWLPASTLPGSRPGGRTRYASFSPRHGEYNGPGSAMLGRQLNPTSIQDSLMKPVLCSRSSRVSGRGLRLRLRHRLSDHCAKLPRPRRRGETKTGKKLGIKDYTDPKLQAEFTDQTRQRDQGRRGRQQGSPHEALGGLSG